MEKTQLQIKKKKNCQEDHPCSIADGTPINVNTLRPSIWSTQIILCKITRKQKTIQVNYK